MTHDPQTGREPLHGGDDRGADGIPSNSQPREDGGEVRHPGGVGAVQPAVGTRAKIELPWPPKELSPNARGHWSKGYKAQRKYKDLCLWMMLGQAKPRIEGGDRIPLTITMWPPDSRHRDRD